MKIGIIHSQKTHTEHCFFHEQEEKLRLIHVSHVPRVWPYNL